MTSLLSILSNRRCFIIGLVIFLISFETSLSLFEDQAQSLAASKDDIIAMVNDNPIEKSKFNRLVQEYKAKSGKDVVTMDERKRLIHNIIIRQLILQHSSVQAIKHDKAFIKKIKEYENEMLIKLFLEKKIGSKMIVTDEEILKYYQLNQDKFKTSKRVSARVILLRNREEAEIILTKLKNGQDFATLVTEHSVDLPSASNGGILEIEEGKFFPQIEKAVFNLKENEVSEIIETSFGCNLFKVEKIIPVEIKPYDDVKDEIKKQILKQKEAKAFFEMAAGLEKDADVKIFEKITLGISSIHLSDKSILTEAAIFQGTTKWYISLVVLLILSGTLMVLKKSNAATYTVYPTDDAYVDEQSPHSNKSALNYLQIGGYGDSAHGYLKFTLDSLDSNERIIKATFSIFGWWAGSDSGIIDLYHIADDSWTEETLTWENQPDNLEDTCLLGSRELLLPFTRLGWDLFDNENWNPSFDQTDGFLSFLITTKQRGRSVFFSKEMSGIFTPYIRIVTKIGNDNPTEPPIATPAPSSLLLLLIPWLLILIKLKKKHDNNWG